MTPRVGDRFREETGIRLETELELCRLALTATHEGVIIHREDGTLALFNEAAAVNLGFTPEEFAQLPPWGWSPAESPEARAKRLALIRRPEGHTFLSERTLPDGTPLIQEVRTRYVDSEFGGLIVSVSYDVTDRVRAERMLHDLAFHDALTGLPNRTAFEKRLAAAMESALRHGDHLGIVYLDLDDFKLINDGYGHCVGDTVLVAIARRLEWAVRAEDAVARLGGDEFVVILPRLESPDGVDRVADKLRKIVAKRLKINGEMEFRLSAAAGTAVFDPDFDDARSLVARADIAMYAAKKRTGRVP
jgi:diguanylate cyclase (GGDEF)-like protein/PAS domain S-box-containing protein